jgi:hypothetical protein
MFKRMEKKLISLLHSVCVMRDASGAPWNPMFRVKGGCSCVLGHHPSLVIEYTSDLCLFVATIC